MQFSHVLVFASGMISDHPFMTSTQTGGEGRFIQKWTHVDRGRRQSHDYDVHNKKKSTLHKFFVSS